jgi:tetratricopeptide (TPR) repeat protein
MNVLALRKYLFAAGIAFSVAAAAHADPLADGRRLISEGRLVEAVEILEKAASADPANAATWNALGGALNRLEHYERALTAAERAVALDAGSFGHRFNRGLVYWEHGRFSEAVSDFEAALQLRPGFAPALTERGASLAALERLHEAKQSWIAALAADPAYVWPHYYHGLASVVAGDFVAAAADLDTVAAKETLFSAQIWRWVAYRRQGLKAPELSPPAEWPGAIGLYLDGQMTAEALLAEANRMRLSIDDRRLASAWYFIGQKHLAEGRVDHAKAAFRNAIAIKAPRHSERAGAEAELERLDR